MKQAQPITFEPIFMERIWGGRTFETRFGKALPPGKTIGEIWELVDRPQAESVVRNGLFRGQTLHHLWTNERESIFGQAYASRSESRFPILVKLLDARQNLSVQVHPPPTVAPLLGGESKTEMWYFLEPDPNAVIYAGLKQGVSKDHFKQQLATGMVESTLHQVKVSRGQTMYIPSGRIHAIGEGNVIVEIQQNSDTTYRVFDWNRVASTSEPRKLHIEEALASINFNDHEPSSHDTHPGLLTSCPYFQVEKQFIRHTETRPSNNQFAIICVIEGRISINGLELSPAAFCLLPANVTTATFTPLTPSAELLIITLPTNRSQHELPKP